MCSHSLFSEIFSPFSLQQILHEFPKFASFCFDTSSASLQSGMVPNIHLHRSVTDCSTMRANQTCQKPVYILSRQTFEQFLGGYHPETFEVCKSLIRSKRRNADLINAEADAIALVKLTAPSVLRNRISHRAASVELVHVLKDQQRYTEACKLCLNILEQDRLDQTQEWSLSEFPGKPSIYTLEDIAELCRLRGLPQAESQYLAQALPAALRTFGLTAPTMHIWEKLHSSMTGQGRGEELGGLAQIFLGHLDRPSRIGRYFPIHTCGMDWPQLSDTDWQRWSTALAP